MKKPIDSHDEFYKEWSRVCDLYTHDIDGEIFLLETLKTLDRVCNCGHSIILHGSQDRKCWGSNRFSKIKKRTNKCDLKGCVKFNEDEFGLLIESLREEKEKIK